MEELTNRRHEALAQLVAGGMLRSRACAVVYPDCNGTTASNYGGRVAARPEVSARIAELQGESAGKATMVLGQRLCYLRDVALTPYAEVDERSVLCGSVHRGLHGVYYQMPDKLWALNMYSKLAGDFDERAVRPTFLGRVIARIRADGGRLPREERVVEEAVVVERPGERVLRSGPHEKFAQLVAGGERYARSYTLVYETGGKAAEQNAYMLGKRPEVRARIKYLQGQASAWANWAVEYRMRYLQDFIRMPIGEINEESIYCQGVHLNKFGREVRVPSKMQAIELYTKLERNKAQDWADGMANAEEILERIRQPRAA